MTVVTFNTFSAQSEQMVATTHGKPGWLVVLFQIPWHQQPRLVKSGHLADDQTWRNCQPVLNSLSDISPFHEKQEVQAISITLTDLYITEPP